MLLLIDDFMGAAGLQVIEISVVPGAGDDVHIRSDGTDEFNDGAGRRGVGHGDDHGARGGDADVFEHIGVHRITDVSAETELMNLANHARIKIDHGDTIRMALKRMPNGLPRRAKADDDEVILGRWLFDAVTDCRRGR